MKKTVLALVDTKGSRFHRLIVPLTLLDRGKWDVRFATTHRVSPSMLQGVDYLMVNWQQGLQVAELSLLRKEFGFKLIQDIDDYWILPRKHLQKDLVDRSTEHLENQLILADKVLCTTDFLKEKIEYYNPNVYVRKNYIPVGIDEFKVETRLLSPSDKIAIGICGSHSHFPDWLSIERDIERMKNDPEIQENCEFVVAGHGKGENWNKMFDLFTYRKNGVKVRPKMLPAEPINTYMKLYGAIDILLAPLVYNDFNKAKSELKLFEAACKSAIVVSGTQYRDKGYNEYCVVEGEMSYYRWVKKLLDKDYLNPLKVEYQNKLLLISKQYQSEYSLDKYL